MSEKWLDEQDEVMDDIEELLQDTPPAQNENMIQQIRASNLRPRNHQAQPQQTKLLQK